ncbi:3'-5' exonuclease [Buttiauxella gaviniae]|uniref:3'-5' exonuclease n=1 Tax=Buttiauxella gaviniae TaxID=82990 RepID=UPI003974908B
MAKLIPSLSSCSGKITSGEKRLGRKLESTLSDNCLCWYDVWVGSKTQKRYPDFIVLNPDRGMFFLEVKDWKIDNIKEIDKLTVKYLRNERLESYGNPLEQVRQYAYTAINTLASDNQLVFQQGKYAGKPLFPYGYAVFFSFITRKQLDTALTIEEQNNVLPPHMIICSDEINDPALLATKLWNNLPYSLKDSLSTEQVDRVRWHIYPEVRLNHSQMDLLEDSALSSSTRTVPVQVAEMTKVMSIHQEDLARSMGNGHRIIHGVAGSGKTVILLYRCLYLAEELTTPILVVCFNVTLAASLRGRITAAGLGNRVEIVHFHGWCKSQFSKANLKSDPSRKAYEQHVEDVIAEVDRGGIPTQQYGAILIDEGHDFKPEWLSLLSKMTDAENGHLLFLYDDAQTIYQKSCTLDFSLASVGIQAKGRTQILRINYRNTREILSFAYNFAGAHLKSKNEGEHCFIDPETAGTTGEPPELQIFSSQIEEGEYVVQWIKSQKEKLKSWNDIAIICTTHQDGDYFERVLKENDIPHAHLRDSNSKKNYNPVSDVICIVTIQSSKGLEFKAVAMVGSSHMTGKDEDLTDHVRRLYVGFTRATKNLLVTMHEKNSLSQLIEDGFELCEDMDN